MKAACPGGFFILPLSKYLHCHTKRFLYSTCLKLALAHPAPIHLGHGGPLSDLLNRY